MAVYFYKLFDKMSELNITQKELMQRIGASSATLTKMRNNQNVSLEVLDRICEELNCDIGDIVTCVPPQAELDTQNNDLSKLNAIARNVLNTYMNECNLSINDIVGITGLSLNTVKSFLKGKNISAISHSKLLRLGERYSQCLGKAVESSFDQKSKERIYGNS